MIPPARLRDAWLAVARRRINVCHRFVIPGKGDLCTHKLSNAGGSAPPNLRPVLWAAGGEFASGLGGLRLSELGLLLNGGLRLLHGLNVHVYKSTSVCDV